MKRFKDLNNKQKKQAIDAMFDRRLNYEQPTGNADADYEISKIKGSMNFCGCLSCRTQLFEAIKTRSVIKELILGKAQSDAEGAYYPEESDTIIKVK